MVLVKSQMVPLGSPMPEFSLPDVTTGQLMSSQQLTGQRGTLVMFICRHCPYVQHVKHELKRLADDYQPQGINLIAISANDAEHYPEDAPESLAEFASQMHYPFVLLYDQDQSIAQAFRAMCTPDFFLYDSQGKLFYRGQLDDSRPGNNLPVTGKDLRQAIDALLADENPPEPQKPASGCSIKWKPGNQPDYWQ